MSTWTWHDTDPGLTQCPALRRYANLVLRSVGLSAAAD